MQTMSRAMPWIRVLRPIALVLAVVLALEWTVPVTGHAQPNPGAIPTVSAGNQELPPMQEAEVIEVRKPFYKTWWFWTIVGVVVVGAGAAAAMGGGSSGGGSSPPAAGPSGTVTVNGPAPR